MRGQRQHTHGTDPPDSGPESGWTGSSSGAPQPPRRWLDRYQRRLWIGGVSLIVIAALVAPVMWGACGAPNLTARPATVAAPASMPTSVFITATEFEFSPNSIQVQAGQKVSLTLQNTGGVEHDVTIPSLGFSLLARAGQTVTGEFGSDKPGVVDFFCAVPGHRDAGMKGTLTVVD